MSEYRLTVVRIDPNPAYDADDARRAQENALRYGSGYNAAQYPHAATIEARVLDVTLTEMEYETVKRAVVEVWK